MATWLPHLKLAFGGPLGANIDEWSCSVRLKCSTDDGGNIPSVEYTDAQIEAALTGLVTPLSAWFAKNSTFIHASATMTYAKLNWIRADGKQRDINTHRRDFAPVNGGGSGTPPPWFVTAALTMRTNYARGRGHAGRIFPPLISAATGSGTPYFSAADATAMAASWATALNDISKAVQTARGTGDVTPVYPVIGSPATSGGPNAGGPLLLRVTGVVVDRVPDVQHRRTNRVPRAEGTRAAVTGGP